MFRIFLGWFFILIIIFVMVVEILIFVLLIVWFCEDYFLLCLECVQIVLLVLLVDDMISKEFEIEFLCNVEVYNVVFRCDEVW